MDIRPKLFVSHSSDDTEVARAIGGALGVDFHVWLDADFLRGGDDWQLKIEGALADCDCAIVLLSPAVLARPTWVGNEAFFLSVRQRQLQPSLTIIPVLLPGFVPADLGHATLSPARLPVVQSVAIDPAALDVTAIVAGFASILTDFASRLPYERIERELASKLSRLDVHAREIVAEDLGLDLTILNGMRNPFRWLAAHLLRAKFEVLQRAHASLAELDAQLARDLFRAVAPYTWIGSDAALAVSRAGAAAPPKLPLGMTALRRETPRLYVKRASHKLAGWLTFDCDGDFTTGSTEATALEQTILQNIRRSLAAKAGFADDDTPTDAELIEELEGTLDPPEPIFVLLPPWFARMDGTLLERLRAAFPRIIFMIWTDMPGQALPQKFTDLVVLPTLESAAERHIYRVYARCLPGESVV